MRRVAGWTVVLALLATSACSSDPADDRDEAASPDSSESTPPPPPTPAEKLGLADGWGPTQDQLDAAARRVRSMSVPDLAGQVIVASYRGTQAPVSMVRSLHLGGVIVFADNVTSAAQITAQNKRLRARVGRPLLVSVDQEGGTVARVGGEATSFPAFMSTGAAADSDLTRASYAASGAELRSFGFSMDNAPDADVTLGPQDPVIGSRSASSDPAVVAEQAVAAAQGYLDAGVLPVLKHFPGHGSVTTDSHRALPVQSASLKQLRRRDFLPFVAGVEASLPAIMVGHIAVRDVSPRLPASLSRPLVTGVLRRELGFDGVVITDALEMGAVAQRFNSAEAAVRALTAGVDVVLMPPDPAAARRGIIRAVRSGSLERRRLEQAAARMLAVLAHQRTVAEQAAPAPAAQARQASRRLSASAVTMVAGSCRPQRLVGGAVSPTGDPEAVSAFAGAAGAAGLDVLLRRAAPSHLLAAEARPTRKKKEKPKDYRARVRAWQAREAARRADLASWEAAENARLAQGTSVALNGFGSGTVSGEITVATDTPYVLGRVSSPVRIATYGETAGAMSVLVDVLLGRAKAPGRLPVAVPGAPRRGC